MSIAIVNGRLITPIQEISAGTVLIGTDGRIAGLGESAEVRIPDGASIVDVAGDYVVPGFIDLHVHGAVGHDVLEARPEGLRAIAAYHASHGTTSWLPTLATAHLATMTAAFRASVDVQREGTGSAQILGTHLEGPFISPERKGAQPERHILAASPKMLENLLHTWPDVPRIVTLAPERAGRQVIQLLRDWGVLVGAGHSNATYEEMIESIVSGVGHVTHLFNAMTPLHQRAPGLVGAVLTEPHVRAELIADGLHVHPAVLKLTFRILGPERLALVTDSISAGGMSQGCYRLSGQAVYYDGTSVALPDGTLAGSVLTMDRAVANMVHMAGCSVREAVWMACLTPAQILGLDQQKGCLELGWDADIVRLDAQDLRVKSVWIAGREYNLEAGDTAAPKSEPAE